MSSLCGLFYRRQSEQLWFAWTRRHRLYTTNSPLDAHRKGLLPGRRSLISGKNKRGRRDTRDTRCFSHKQMNRARVAPLSIVAHLVNASHTGFAFIAIGLPLRP